MAAGHRGVWLPVTSWSSCTAFTSLHSIDTVYPPTFRPLHLLFPEPGVPIPDMPCSVASSPSSLCSNVTFTLSPFSPFCLKSQSLYPFTDSFLAFLSLYFHTEMGNHFIFIFLFSSLNFLNILDVFIFLL